MKLKRLLALGVLVLTSSCGKAPKTWICYPKVHVVTCGYCGYNMPRCTRTTITFVTPEGKVIQVTEPEGFKCDLYLLSTYWELHVSTGEGGMFIEGDVVAKRMVK